MTTNTFMDKIRLFFGYRLDLPTNDFRNPIWGSDDEDDGDELYTRQRMDVYNDAALDLNQEFAKQMHDMFKSFSSMFDDMKVFFHDDFKSFFQDEHMYSIGTVTDEPPEPDNFDSNSLRNYYLKPGYHNRHYEQTREDVDLDGKISSNEISGLLKQNDEHSTGSITPFNGTIMPGRSFCQTIITTSVTKPDGSIETRRIMKNGNEVVEETITSSSPDVRDSLQPINSGIDSISGSGIIYSHIMSELSSLFRNFY